MTLITEVFVDVTSGDGSRGSQSPVAYFPDHGAALRLADIMNSEFRKAGKEFSSKAGVRRHELFENVDEWLKVRERRRRAEALAKLSAAERELLGIADREADSPGPSA